MSSANVEVVQNAWAAWQREGTHDFRVEPYVFEKAVKALRRAS